MRATEAARSAQADLVIGVGAGSVIQGARIVTILLAEKRPVEQLVTQYPGHGPAVSPKLLEPKLPVINVLTAPTTAQNRAGSRMKDDATARGMEFFDPKTRPVAIFWDADALLTAPPQLIRTGAATIWCRAVMSLGAMDDNPLVEGDRLQSYRLASGAIPRIADRMDTVFRSLGMPTRLSELGIARERLPQVLELSLANFNADPKREFVRERGMLEEVLAEAW